MASSSAVAAAEQKTTQEYQFEFLLAAVERIAEELVAETFAVADWARQTFVAAVVAVAAMAEEHTHSLTACLAGEEVAVEVHQGHIGRTEKKTAETDCDHRSEVDPDTNVQDLNGKNHSARNHRDHDRRRNDRENGLGGSDSHHDRRHDESHDHHLGDDNHDRDLDSVPDSDHSGHLEDIQGPVE